MLRPLLAIVALIGLARIGDRLLAGSPPPRVPAPLAPVPARSGPRVPDFGDFAALMREHVLPLRQREPGREELGPSAATVARFKHDGTLWRVHGDSRLAPLLAAWEWSRKHPGEDPFRPGSARGRRQALSLRDEVGWTRPAHFYAYADV